ncbi:MAG: glycerol-3-phosphate acyltransferase [Lentisphaeria bacterium]|nr:MAG: glycerol-3-phosphate acyltransferase [Lentisphaeria bacterium]
MAPYPLLIAFVSWVIVFLVWRYVSLASIVAAVVLPCTAILLALCGIGGATATSGVTIGFFLLISLLAIYRHRSNIARLLNGTESRFEKKKHGDAK